MEGVRWFKGRENDRAGLYPSGEDSGRYCGEGEKCAGVKIGVENLPLFRAGKDLLLVCHILGIHAQPLHFSQTFGFWHCAHLGPPSVTMHRDNTIRLLTLDTKSLRARLRLDNGRR